jgi:hypothetical protein
VEVKEIIYRKHEQTFDNGFILAGSSTSTISGDKTELNLGGNDIWLIKLAGTGV